MLHLFKKKLRKTAADIIDLQFMRYGTKHTEIGNFRSFFPFHCPSKNPKNQNFEK